MFGNKHDLADKLQNTGTSISQNANSVLAVMVGASVELAQGMGRLPGAQRPFLNLYSAHPHA